MAGFRGAIFDMDGTLVESMPEWRKQNIEFAKRHHVEVPEEMRGCEMDTSAHRAAKLYAQLYPQLGMTPEEIDAEYERELLPIYCSTVERKKGILPFLEMLKENHVRICVATATSSGIARQCLEHLGIAQYMEFIISGKDLGFSKAKPIFFPRIAQMLGVEKDDCVVFEDALYAIQSAYKAGMRVFAVEDWCARNSRDEIGKLATVFRRDFDGLLPVVRAMFAADHVCSMRR